MRIFRLNSWGNIKGALLHLIYPHMCIICEEELPSEAQHICVFCTSNLRFTYFENFINEDSPLDQLFYGRIPINATYALLHFDQNTGTQDLLHRLKYKHNKTLGIFLGREIGHKILSSPKFKDLDMIIPMPIHSSKEFIRGYNQSETLAQGLSEILNVPVNLTLVKKSRATESQTKKGRFERWDNVQLNFITNFKKNTPIQHVAIIDDVITTGSSIESLCVSLLEYYPKLKISLISLAYVQ